MLVTYMRSSSYSNFDFCQMQYFISYVLGIQRETGVKALKGTATHKVLELLAKCKKEMQNNEGASKFEIYDRELKTYIEWTEEQFLKPYVLTNEEVDEVNRTRINKQTYKDACAIDYGHTRYGVELVESLVKRVNKYFGDGWAPVDYRDVANWVWMTLDFGEGDFDPRRRKIIAAEPHFNYAIEREWAKFDWNLPNGKNITGNLGIKGTIDLITEVAPGIIEIVDWKSGQRLNWASKIDNDIKTYDKLQEDFQLMLYHYAAKRMYPDAKQIMVTIFFIRDGGPFTMCFDDRTLEQTEEKIRKRFNEISACVQPTMQDPTQENFKCKYICDYFKQKGPDGETNLCRHIHDQIVTLGIDHVTKEYTRKGFNIGHYEAPGEK